MEETIVTSLFLPAAVFVIMLGLGLSLTVADFKRILVEPRAALIGLSAQIIVIPILAFGIAIALNLSPMLAVGLMLLGSVPGGPTSNLISHASRADTALSVTLTAISSMVILVTLPLIMSFSIDYFVGETQTVSLPVLATMGQLFALAVLPVLVGMGIRVRWTDFALRMERTVRVASVVLFVLIVLGLVVTNWQLILDNIGTVGGAVLALNLLTLLAGYLLARAGRLSVPQRVSVMIEAGIQNGTLAIVIATTLLKSDEASIPPGLYSLVMLATGGLVIGWYSTRGKQAITAEREKALVA